MTQDTVFLILGFVIVGLVFWKVFGSARKRQSSAEAYMERGEAESLRHAAAVEAKLDRIIAILEKNQESGNS
jgi:hypothetical protein